MAENPPEPYEEIQNDEPGSRLAHQRPVSATPQRVSSAKLAKSPLQVSTMATSSTVSDSSSSLSVFSAKNRDRDRERDRERSRPGQPSFTSPDMGIPRRGGAKTPTTKLRVHSPSQSTAGPMQSSSNVANVGKKFDPSSAYQPNFYFGGHNGEKLVDSILSSWGWKRCMEKQSEVKLRWTETKGSIDWKNFKEGEMLVNHIPNCELLTNKLGLLMSLREFERLQVTIKNKTPKLKLTDFHPETYVLDDKGEFEMFCEEYKPGDIWICKPTGLNQGIGIYLVRDLEQFKKDWAEKEGKYASGRGPPKAKMGRIIQRYIRQPLLLEDRKFDIRCYMLIACTQPFLMLWHHGYVRRSIHPYNLHHTDISIHLTNQYIQKKDPSYEEVKQDTVWTMEHMNDYFNDTIVPEKGLERDWVFNVLTKRIHQIVTHMVNCVKSKLSSKVGYFELYGLDFMIDEDMKVWLIEVNINPSLTTNCEVLHSVIPPIVEESLAISLECFEKARRHQQLMPLQSLKTFDILISGGTGGGGSPPPGAGQSIRYSPPPNKKNVRDAASPSKEPIVVRSPAGSPGTISPRASSPQIQNLRAINNFRSPPARYLGASPSPGAFGRYGQSHMSLQGVPADAGPAGAQLLSMQRQSTNFSVSGAPMTRPKTPSTRALVQGSGGVSVPGPFSRGSGASIPSNRREPSNVHIPLNISTVTVVSASPGGPDPTEYGGEVTSPAAFGANGAPMQPSARFASQSQAGFKLRMVNHPVTSSMAGPSFGPAPAVGPAPGKDTGRDGNKQSARRFRRPSPSRGN